MAGVVAALSVVSDLARGHPPGEAIRACLLATVLASRAGLDERRQGEVYYGTLMRFAGCAATSHEIAAVFGGDDIVVRARSDLIDPAEPGEALEFLAVWVPIIHPCWSGSMSVLVEGAAESVSSADIEVRDPLRIGDRFG